MKHKHIFWPITVTILLVILTVATMVLYFQSWDKKTLSVPNESAQIVKESSDKNLDF